MNGNLNDDNIIKGSYLESSSDPIKSKLLTWN